MRSIAVSVEESSPMQDEFKSRPHSPLLEYEHEQPVEELLFSIKRAVALGYVAACIAGLITMSIVMALSI